MRFFSACRRVNSYLNAYVDRELPLKKRIYLETHLVHCTVCQKRLIAIKRLNGKLSGALDVPPIPANLAAGIMRDARRRSQTRLKTKTHFPSPVLDVLLWYKKISFSMRIALCAVFVLAVIAGVAVERHRPLTHQHIGETPRAEIQGLEWFGPAMPDSIASIYISLTAQNDSREKDDEK